MLSLSACGGSSGSSSTTTVSSDDGLAAASLSVAASDVLGRVEVINLSTEDAVGVELRLRAGDSDIGVPLFIDGNVPYFMAPMSPSNPRGGGGIELFLQKGDERGPTLQLDLAPMPDAPGAWASFVTEFTAAVDRDARQLGSSFELLQATEFDEIEPALIALKLAQAYVDDGSSNDLESFPDFPELTDDDRAMLDSLTALIGAEALFDRPAAQGFRLSPATTQVGQPESSTSSQLAGLKTVAGFASSARLEGFQDGCIDAGIEVPDAEALSSMISTAKFNTLDSDDARRDVLDKIGTATTVGGFIPGLGWVIAGGGAGFIALETYLNGTAGLYPSALTNLQTQINLPEFPEDFTIDGSWTDVMVTATSTGWTADVDVARTLLATMSTATSALSGLNTADGLALDVSLYLRDNAANQIVSEQAEDGGMLSFCPQQWSVDVTGEPWTTGRAVLERFEVDSSLRNYRPIETGLNLPVDDTLRIEVKQQLFGGESVFDDHMISVKPIMIGAPTVVEVDAPGDEFKLEASVSNATDSELDWDGGKGGWRGDARLLVAGEIVGAPAVWERTHVTPSSASAFPYLVVLEPTTTTGLRADGNPPRRKVVEVRLKELIIKPDPGRVLKNKSITFTAYDTDGNPVDVSWRATGGQTASNGVYTAGPRVGTYTVTAVSKADPDITATATVQIVEAECVTGQWRLRTQEFLDQISQAMGQSGSFQHVSGEYVVTLADDGSYRGERRSWVFSMAADGQTLQITIDSAETGSWIVDPPAALMVIEESTSDATVSFSVNGQSLPFAPQTVSTPGVAGSGTYECDGDVMTLTVVDEGLTVEATLDRIG